MIGVAVFREAGRVEVSDAPPTPRFEGAAKAAPAPSLGAQPAPESHRADAAAAGSLAPIERDRLGTGHGERETSIAHVTTFQRASARPDQRVEIRYDSLDNLVAAGIVPPPHVATTSTHAFPADPPRGDYVVDPPQR